MTDEIQAAANAIEAQNVEAANSPAPEVTVGNGFDEDNAGYSQSPIEYLEGYFKELGKDISEEIAAIRAKL